MRSPRRSEARVARVVRRALLALVAAVVLATPALAWTRPDPTPDLPAADVILWNGPIHTGDIEQPDVEALAIRDGKVLYAGPRERVERLRAEWTQVIDLRGAAAFPGFVDGHAHLAGIGERELTFNLEGVPSIAALQEAVRVRIAGMSDRRRVLTGRGWIETHWPEGRFPTRDDLDAASPDTPVLLVRADGHALVANSAALKAARITDATRAPPGGEILRDANGRATGMLIDNAMDLVAPLRDRAEHPSFDAALDAALRVYPARGWTGVHNMSVHWADSEALIAREDRAPMPLRIYNAVTPEAGARLLRTGIRQSRDGRVVTRAIKYYADGALGSRGAALFAPYADAPQSSGLVTLDRKAADRVFERALHKGIQIATHAIGDRGNALVLDAYEQAFRDVPPAARAVQSPRWRIEHAQILRPADFPRFRKLGVIASMQPSHAIGDLHFAPARLGPGRLRGAYAWKTLVTYGAVVVGGSDAPVERGDPLIEFYAAVARRDLSGFSGPGWRPEETVDRATALQMFTAWPAYAAFEEASRGVLREGMAADVSVFSVDLMTAPVEAIPKGRALMTMIDGKIAWRADGW